MLFRSFKGGQLAKKCQPAEVLSLILSDVVGDPIDTIASGPTTPDSKTWLDAEVILKKYEIWGETPPAITERIKAELQGVFPILRKRMTQFLRGQKTL